MGEKSDTSASAIPKSTTTVSGEQDGGSSAVGESATTDADPSTPSAQTDESQAQAATVATTAHVGGTGWQSESAQGDVAGTVGQGKRLEAVKITDKAPDDTSYSDADISYRAHVQNVGWQSWADGGGTAGTVGRGLSIEAVRIELTDELQQHYDVWYRAHVQTLGWMGWTKNGNVCGTTGLAGRMEGLQVVLTPKGAAAPSAASQAVSFSHLDAQQVEYAVSPVNGQWEANVRDGGLAGSTGQGRALQALRVQRTGDTTALAGAVQYRAFVQNKR